MFDFVGMSFKISKFALSIFQLTFTWVGSLILSRIVSLSFPTYWPATTKENGFFKRFDSFKNRYFASQKKKILVLDLDETLVHSTTKEVSKYDMCIHVALNGVSCTFYVIKRPNVEKFLQEVSKWYEVVVFTASLKDYADPVVDQLDPKGVVKKRYFRDSCKLNKEGYYVKNLSVVNPDLSRVIIVDNSPVAYSMNKENAIAISDWVGDNSGDQALQKLLPFLKNLKDVEDVRTILKEEKTRW